MRKPCRQSGKIKFSTYEQALKRAGEIMERDKRLKSVTAYRCNFCGHFHLTTNKVKTPLGKLWV